MKNLNQDYNFTKSLKQYISESLRVGICDEVKVSVSESLRIGICDEVKVSASESLRIGINDNPYDISPTAFNELRHIIEDRYREFGPGTASNPINFNDIDVSGMTKFFEDRGLFENTKFEYIDVSEWDVSNIKTMNSMFYDCNKLESIGDISNWDVSCVENMRYMFGRCNNLKSVGNLSEWNVSNVGDMQWMFSQCNNLQSVGDISNWDVSNVGNMNWMFYGSGITNIPDWYEA